MCATYLTLRWVCGCLLDDFANLGPRGLLERRLLDSIRFPSGLELNRKITIACAGERLDTLDATDMDRLHLSWPRQHTGKM
jgi:hypothetical protein